MKITLKDLTEAVVCLSREPEKAYELLLGFLAKEYEADGYLMMAKDPQNGEPVIKFKSPGLEDNFSRSLLKHVIETGETLCIDDLTKSEFKNNDSIANLKILSALILPLKHEDTAFGALYLDRRGMKRPFGVAHVKEIGPRAEALSGAIYHRESELLAQAEQQRRLELHRKWGLFIGNSPAMQKLYVSIEDVANSSAPVYIFGESGSGKELVAAALHQCSNRRSKPFVALDCGAFANKELAASALFGHERGAFTDAKNFRKGKFEEAGAGVLFLDEIGELSLDIQASLLRVLEKKELTRIGGTGTISVQARVIVATQKDLKIEVAEKRFRNDLFHRLSVLRIDVPPLRERPEDIPLLANFFLEEQCREIGKRIPGFTREAMAALQAHPWRENNVRDLRNVIMRAVVHHRDYPPIDVAELFPDQPAGAPDIQLTTLKGKTLDEAKGLILRESFAEHNGSISKMAKALDVKRDWLYRNLPQHGVSLKAVRKEKRRRQPKIK